MHEDPPPGAARPPDGTQTVRRAVALLKTVAAAGTGGATLAELARAQGLARSTVHRLLNCLREEGLVATGGADKRYLTGPLVHELALVPTADAAEVARWRPVVEAVARRTGATAYLMRRSGVEAVCLVKVDGQAVMRFVPVEVGQRRLLGVGAGATALLAALDDGQVAQVLRTIAPGLAAYPRLDPDSLRRAVALARRTGFAISQGTVVANGFGMGLVAPGGQAPHLAVSIAAHAGEVTESLIGRWQQVLREEVSRVAAPADPAAP